MSLVVPTPSRDVMLANILNKTPAQNLVLRLYTNDLTPDDDTVAADFVEQSGHGYAAVALDASSWTITNGLATYPQTVFTFNSAAATVYGYYITEVTSGKLKYAERFPTPDQIANNGDEVKVTPKLSMTRQA